MDTINHLTRRAARDMTIQADAVVLAAVRDRWQRDFTLDELRGRLAHRHNPDGSDDYWLDDELLVTLGQPETIRTGSTFAARRSVMRYAPAVGTKVSPFLRFDRVPARPDPLVALAACATRC